MTPSCRHLIKINQKSLNIRKKPILKNKIQGVKNSSGRNHSGKITVFHIGSGVKRKYRDVSFDSLFSLTGIVCSLEHDPNRNAHIASVFDIISMKFFYFLAPQNLKVGDIIKSGLKVEPSLGSSMPVEKIPEGTPVYNLCIKKTKKAQISRAAGTFSLIREKTENQVVIQTSSGKNICISSKCFASVGEVSKELHCLTRLGKAGQSRWLNRRPIVRGVAMNPVDHPHGGGEGKKSGKSKTPWG